MIWANLIWTSDANFEAKMSEFFKKEFDAFAKELNDGALIIK
jgi:hypothetical protein